MRFLTLLVVPLLGTWAFCQMAAVQARMSSVSITQCRRAESTYEIDIEGTFEIENTSNRTLLVSRKIDMIETVSAASSPEELRQKKYSLAVTQWFGGSVSGAAPRLEDFIALKPGEKGVVSMSAVVPASSDPTFRGDKGLRPGRSWVQFQFCTLPYGFPWGHKNMSFWKRKWRSTGLLLTGDFLTDPFPVDWSPEPKARQCG